MRMRFCLAPVCGSLVGWAGGARSVCGRLWSVLNGSAVGDQRPVVPRPRKRQGHRHSGRSTHHRHRPGLFRSMHACDWASKPPAAAVLQGVRRPASPRSLHFPLHPHPCRPMARPQHHSLRRTIPHLQSARGCSLRVAVVILGVCMPASMPATNLRVAAVTSLNLSPVIRLT